MNKIVENWIRQRLNSGESVEWLMILGNENDLEQALRQQHKLNDWPELTIADWQKIVSGVYKSWCDENEIAEAQQAAIIGNETQTNGVNYIPSAEDSAWINYKNYLHKKGFSDFTIDKIEKDSFNILRFINFNDPKRKPVKGLVCGNVQSGKTANMSALISMAADYGCNMFIILSGSHEGLRQQTLKRFTNDLSREGQGSKYSWHYIDQPSLQSPYYEQLNNLSLGTESTDRHIIVTLKNKSRLKDLIRWILRTPEKAQDLRIIVIDDESDQASVNTRAAQNERTQINKLIINLLNGTSPNRRNLNCGYGAINYVGYTATPYANLLNENDEGSLYPRDLISTLHVSDEYFGPQQIFGDDLKYDGLSIIRTIEPDEIEYIDDIQKNAADIYYAPKSLSDSIVWFICAAACKRFWKIASPVSMLVHTSMKKEHHQKIAELVRVWFRDNKRDEILTKCENIWKAETKAFSLNDFRKQFYDYGANRGHVEIKDYPSFDSIKPYILELIDNGLSTIEIDDNQELMYGKGIHLCIDNSDTQNVASRLFYPEEKGIIDQTPAFIVIGGNTLSRGLTIEGLVSTYFLRSARTADTLMQMGRWFGYRRGYELLPRIFTSEATVKYFKFLSALDLDCRSQIYKMSRDGVDCSEVAPRILNSPFGSKFRLLAQNRQNAAVEVDFDFSGSFIETSVFDNTYAVLKENLDTTENFIKSLGNPDTTPHIHQGYHHVWRNIPLDTIISFLEKFELSTFDRRNKFQSEYIDWLKQMTDEGQIENWNVVLAGKKEQGVEWNPSEGVKINMISHANRIDKDDHLSLGVLRSANDYFSDILSDGNVMIRDNASSNQRIQEFRRQHGMGKTPLIVINIVDKDSMPNGDQAKYFPLRAKEHIAGYSILIPGEYQKGKHFKRVTTIMPPKYDIKG